MFVCFFFFLQYSEKALYNQLSFYRFIFDWDYAFNKVLTPEDRGETRTQTYTHTHTLSLLFHMNADIYVRACAHVQPHPFSDQKIQN